MALTGDPISAERAYALGFVNRLVEPGTVVDEAMALAEQISVNAPLAVRESRKIVLEGMLAEDETAWKITNAGMAKVMSSEDFAEGPKAFIEKRAPVWKGR